LPWSAKLESEVDALNKEIEMGNRYALGE
jgi:hypothetical protein